MMISLSTVAAHLWQSSLFAAAIGVATLTLRKNQAAIRHALWLMASVKFFVPFAVLAAIGAQVSPRLPAAVTDIDVIMVIDNAGPPFPPLGPLIAPRMAQQGWPLASPAIAAAIWLCGAVLVLSVWWVRWRRVASIARQGVAVERGRELDALRRLERVAGIASPIRLVESTASLEPGVFGLIRPVLVWPRAIGERLNEQQVVTILAHEVAHVRRRDNLTAAMHMVVEAIFWFHPLVWWLGARLVDERERACDEAVVRLGSAPEVYAETILTACRTYLESPLACVSGVTGSDLRTRIERIMRGSPCESLSPIKKLIVAGLPAVALVAPILVGILDAPRVRAASLSGSAIVARQSGSTVNPDLPQFEVASVKPNKSGIAGKVSIQTLPSGRFTADNVTLRQLIRNAYMLQDVQLAGGPKWLDDDRFDIVAKASGDGLGDPFLAEQSGQPSRVQLMLRALLADRFNLQVHNEAREMSIYALVAARRDSALGPTLKRSTLECSTPRSGCGLRLMPGNMTGDGVGMSQLANSLAAFVGRIVFDRTELAGDFDFVLAWTPDQISPGFDKKAAAMNLPPIDPNGPSIFTALQEQLGLKLDAQKSPVDVLIVDRAEHPKEN